MSNNLASYESGKTEEKWIKEWEDLKVYSYNKGEKREDCFVIDTPPPTVSGLLHMGHIFSYTQADFIARYMRMSGKNVFYPMGFDDNGLPTERLVEKVKNIRASSMDRQDFVNTCRDVVLESEEEFRKLFRSIGLSVDWEQEYQTISPRSISVSQLSFLDLYNKKAVYRKMQPSLWDPVDRTALAQADIVDSEFKSFMNDINFELEDGSKITIATTRPELIPACVAILYHPEDSRYNSKLKGKFAISPLFKVKVPLIADDTVDIEKGTGLVMCCTFGDLTDIEWWRKHNLPHHVIINKEGRIDDFAHIGTKDYPCIDKETSEKFIAEIKGLKVKEARSKIIDILKAEGLLITQTEITHIVKCAERSGAPLEILVTPQWFIKIMDKKEDLLEKSSECNWYPSYMKIRLDNWIEGLNMDWCISRQRFFGVPFPIWYSKRPGEEGKILIADKDQLPIDPFNDLPKGYTRDEVEPDTDVMDTWATSSVSPQLNSLAINKEFAIDYDRHQELFPADLRPQAHEIIRTWAFYTIVKAYYHENSIPWKNLMISGWCLAADKTKMSKSKGNVVTPVELIKEKSADVVRYWASGSKLGTDIAYSEEVFKIGKKLQNKIWNASKFAATHFDKISVTPSTAAEDVAKNIIFKKVDLWLLSKLQNVIKKSTEEFEKFEYCSARMAIEDFFWNDFCDNYLEIVKVRVYDEENKDVKARDSAVYTLYHVLKTLLELFAPFMPFVTEELYSNLFAGCGMVNRRGAWPKSQDFIFDQEALKSGESLVEVLNLVRKAKADKNLSMKKTIDILSVEYLKDAKIEDVMDDLSNVTNSKEIRIINNLSQEDKVISEGFAIHMMLSE